MKRYVQHLSLFSCLFACLWITGCSDERPELETPERPVGEITLTEIELKRDIKELLATSITLEIKDLDSQTIFEEETSFARFGNYLRFRLKNGLPDGRFMLLSAICHPGNGDPDYEVGMGMTIAITKGDMEETGSYNDEFEFYGSGTEEDPFLITSPKDLNRLKKWVNSDKRYTFAGMYFRQEKSLNLAVQDYSTGWEPIASRPNSPFCGTYDGAGYQIQNLWISTLTLIGKGLFGYSLGATFRNITFTNPQIAADGYSGCLLGVAITEGASRFCTEVWNCKVTGGVVTGKVGMGGLVGSVDQSTMLQLHNCSNMATVQSSIGAGGLVGIGVYSSSILTDSCENKGTVNADWQENIISGIGGLVGAADTLVMMSALNTGDINCPQDGLTKGVGGIAGSAGTGIFTICTNQGTVTGGRGVGGVLGSTVLEMENEKEGTKATYGMAMLNGCINKGEIKGTKMIGGVAGETQAFLNACINTARVLASKTNAGGLIGVSSVMVAQNCLNTGHVSGALYVGGVSALSYFSQVVGCHNFGTISTTEDNAVIGGIIGHSGNNLAIHYCGNFGLIKHTGGKGAAGGVAGMLGVHRDLSPEDWVNIIFTAITMVVGPLFSTIDQLYCAQRVVNGVQESRLVIATVMEYGITIAISGVYALDVYRAWHPEERKRPAVDKEALASRFRMAINDVAEEKQRLFDSKLSTFSLQHPSYADMNQKLALSQQSFAREMQTNDSIFRAVNGAVHDCKEERYKAKVKEKQEHLQAMRIANGIMTGLSIVALAVTTVATAGTALAVTATVAGVVVGTVGGSLSIASTVQNYEENASVVEQSYNQGDLDILDGNVYAGGITGMLNDFGAIGNCYNTGDQLTEHSLFQAGITGYLGAEIQIKSTVNYAIWKSPVYGSQWTPKSNNDCEVYYRDEKNGLFHFGYSDTELKDPKTYKGFLDARYWTLEQQGYPTHTGKSVFLK